MLRRSTRVIIKDCNFVEGEQGKTNNKKMWFIMESPSREVQEGCFVQTERVRLAHKCVYNRRLPQGGPCPVCAPVLPYAVNSHHKYRCEIYLLRRVATQLCGEIPPWPSLGLDCGMVLRVQRSHLRKPHREVLSLERKGVDPDALFG